MNGVLAAIDYEIARYRSSYNEAMPPLANLIAARAAAAELIEADEEYDAARSADFSDPTKTPELDARVERAFIRRQTAIAAFRGEA